LAGRGAQDLRGHGMSPVFRRGTMT
jgi:hypothetical protein